MSREKQKTLKGMQDILPADITLWQKIEAAARSIFHSYGFQEIRTPILEATGVFTRSIGENTDIVEKEMYTFTDKGDRSVSMRPEGTASVVRSYAEHSLQGLPSPLKLFYMGPMFRYERPQSGRLRQFHQIGVEAFGDTGPRIDAEVIAMLSRLLNEIGLEEISFQLNSIGCPDCRPGYRDALLSFFGTRKDELCEDCRRRYDSNPLRILDCKSKTCIELRRGAPMISDHLCGSCMGHFRELRSMLDILGVRYGINHEMVRGLDYYTKTIFEVTSTNLGAQNAVAAGGRYDRLVEEFGGPQTPAIGFAIGMERIIELLKKSGTCSTPSPRLFIAVMGKSAEMSGLRIAEELRKKGQWVELGDASASIKSQMRKADRLSSEYVIVIGDEEISSGDVRWKRLSDSAQGNIRIDKIAGIIETQ